MVIMMRKQCIFSLCLTALLIQTCIGCSSTQDQTGDTQTSPSQTDMETAVTDNQYKANVPDADFGGAEFHVLGPDPNAYQSLLLDFDFEAEPADIVQSAIYQRNRKIEETYNIKFQSEYVSSFDEPRQILEKNVMAGEDAYQLVMLICRNAFPQALKGYALMPEEIPYVDTTQPWYIHHVNEMMSVDGKEVLAYTDECMNAYLQTVGMFFNKNMITSNALEDPYTLVEEGKWTTDKFYEMASAVIRDLNGDGKYDVSDAWGVISEPDMFYPSIWVGAESTTVQKDAQGYPAFVAVGNEKLISLLQNLMEKLNTNGFYFNSFDNFGLEEISRDKGTQLFADGGSLFLVTNIGKVLMLRDMNADFGILPLPKYDEAQETYYGRMLDGWVHIVPSTAEKTEMIGTVIEALGAESKNLVIPAFFDVALTGKLIRDTDSEKMLNLLFDNVTLDLGDTVWYDSVRQPLTSAMDKGQKEFASYFQKQEKRIVKTIQKSMDELENRG